MRILKLFYRLDIIDEDGNTPKIRTLFGVFRKIPKVYFTCLNSHQDIQQYATKVVTRDFYNTVKDIDIRLSERKVLVYVNGKLNSKTPRYSIEKYKHD